MGTKKPGKKLSAKDMKKTKGGLLVSSTQPTFKIQSPQLKIQIQNPGGLGSAEPCI